MTQTQLKDTALAELHEKIYAELEMENKTNPMSYMKFDNAKGRPYQTYERIAFEGLRWSVEKRIAEYGLERYLKPEAKVLDIGSNYGFFVCEFAMKTKLAHGVTLCRSFVISAVIRQNIWGLKIKQNSMRSPLKISLRRVNMTRFSLWLLSSHPIKNKELRQRHFLVKSMICSKKAVSCFMNQPVSSVIRGRRITSIMFMRLRRWMF